MSDNSFQGLQQSKAMPKSTVASKKARRTTRWGCLGITCLLHGARLMLPPQEGTAFLLRALPQPSSSLAALLHFFASTHCPCESFFPLRSSILGPLTFTTEQLSKTRTRSPRRFACSSRSAQGGILSARSRMSKKTIFAGDQRN